MSRVMKGSIITLSLLIIGLVISVSEVISARTTKTEVTGVLDLSAPVVIDPGEVWVDDEGNTHIKNLVIDGTFELTTASGEVISGFARLSMNEVIDEAGSGPSHGSSVVFIGDTILWEGRYEGVIVENIFSGRWQHQGRGPFAGMKLNGTSQEFDPDTGNPADTDVARLEGYILDPNSK